MKLEKTAVVTRPRGTKTNHYHLHLPQQNSSRTYLNLIFTIILSWNVLSYLGARRFLNHQPTIQEGHLSFVFSLTDQQHFSKQAGSHYSGSPDLSLLSFVALFAWALSQTITALARGLSRDRRLPRSPILHHSEHFSAPHRDQLHRITFPETTISCLSCLAFGLFAVLLLRSIGVHPKESDFCPAGPLRIQQPGQDVQGINLHILAAVLITPFSSSQTTLERKIVDSLYSLFKIGAIIDMDQPDSSSHGIYGPSRDHLLEADALMIRDLEASIREQIVSQDINRTEMSANMITPSSRPSTTWAPDPEHGPSDDFSQERVEVKRRAEADGVETFIGKFYAAAPSSNTTLPPATTTGGFSSAYLEQRELISSSSSGPIRKAIRKTKSSIFRQGPSQVDAEIPPMLQQGLFSRATSSILRRNPNREEVSPLLGNGSPGNEESTSSSPDSHGPTNLRRVRNLEFEAQARAMGFEVSQNRFGLPEAVIGSNATPPSQVSTDIRLVRNLAMEEKARALGFNLSKNPFGLREEIIDDGPLVNEGGQDFSSDDGVIVGLAKSDDDYDSAGGESTILDTAEPVPGDHGLRSPPTAANIPVKEIEGGLEYLPNGPSDFISRLTDCFTSSHIDLLNNFGSPPRVSTHSPPSSRSFKITDKTRNGPHNLGSPTMIGDFGTYEAEQVQNPFLDHSQPKQDNPNEADKLRGEVINLRGQIRTLVEKFIAVCKAKDSEIQTVKASEAAAVERVKILEKILELHGIAYGGVEELSEVDDSFDFATNTFGGQYTPTKTGFTSMSKGSSGGESGGKRSSHKKSKSREGSFFKSLIGTTEPSQAAFEKLKKKTLSEANTDEKDPDLAAKLGVSSRQLPPEAPKPASKDPIPKAKNGTMNMLRRLSSSDNLKRKDVKGSSSTESENYSARNASQNSHNSQSKDASLTSITESTGGSKSPEIASGPPSYRDRVTSFSEDSSSPANHQRHSRSSGKELMGQYDSELNLALTALKMDKSQQPGSGAIPAGWEYMGMSRDGHKGGCGEPESMEEEGEKPTGERLVSHGTYNSSVGALVHEDQANLDEDRGNQVLSSKAPSRSPPARPGLQDHTSERREQYFNRHEAQEEQRSRAERFNLNKCLPDIDLEDIEKEEGKKDGKKRGLRNLFTRK
jgi:hypothetical protein